MTVDDLLDDLIRREGGFVNHPADRGGPTKYGITQRTLSQWLGRPATVEEVRTLDEETAREIYVRNYYSGPRIDTLPEIVRAQVLDIGVNSGPRTAIQMLQQVLNLAGFACDTDGVLGPQTRRACESAVSTMGGFLANALAERRVIFYEQLVARRPSQAVFLTGWKARANEFRVAV